MAAARVHLVHDSGHGLFEWNLHAYWVFFSPYPLFISDLGQLHVAYATSWPDIWPCPWIRQPAWIVHRCRVRNFVSRINTS